MLLIIYNDFIIVFNKSVNVLSFSVLIPKMVRKKKKQTQNQMSHINKGSLEFSIILKSRKGS